MSMVLMTMAAIDMGVMNKNIFIAAAFLVCLAACEKTPVQEIDDSGEQLTLYFTGEKPDNQVEVRTCYDPNTKSILWNQSGEYIKLQISNSGYSINESGVKVPIDALRAPVISNEAAVSADGKKATFSLNSVSLPTREGKYRFHSVYPSSAADELGKSGSIWDWRFLVGSGEQKPSAASYDPKADVMVGISKDEYSILTDGMEVPMIFERLVSHVKISLTDISHIAKVTKAVITAPKSCPMAGAFYYINMINKEIREDEGNTQNYVVLNYESSGEEASGGLVVDGSFDLWFCTNPIVIAEGQPLTICLYENDECISRTISARSEGIRFEKNRLSSLKVSMASSTYSELVDLGLSVKWSTCNLGASDTADHGGYYQWAGTEDVSDTSNNLGWDNCPYHTGSDNSTGWLKYNTISAYGAVDNLTVLESMDDAATVILGGNLRMPTTEEWAELLDTDNCTWTWISYNGVKGFEVQSKKVGYDSKSIFLPVTGRRDGGEITSEKYGWYWSSSLKTDIPRVAYSIYIYGGNLDHKSTFSNRHAGLSVRPVSDK